MENKYRKFLQLDNDNVEKKSDCMFYNKKGNCLNCHRVQHMAKGSKLQK